MRRGVWRDGRLSLPLIVVVAQLPALAFVSCMIGAFVQYFGGNEDTILLYAVVPVIKPWVAVLATIAIAAASALLARLGSVRHKLARTVIVSATVFSVYLLSWIVSAIFSVPFVLDALAF